MPQPGENLPFYYTGQAFPLPLPKSMFSRNPTLEKLVGVMQGNKTELQEDGGAQDHCTEDPVPSLQGCKSEEWADVSPSPNQLPSQ